MIEKPFTTGELAEAGGCSKQTVRRLERRGLLRAVRDFRGWRKFSPAEVSRLRSLLGWAVLDVDLDGGSGDRGDAIASDVGRHGPHEATGSSRKRCKQ